MRPGQAAPDEWVADAWLDAVRKASMRPGQAAPDEDGASSPPYRPMTGFNEAGASSPG